MPWVPLPNLSRQLSAFDIGIAPLSHAVAINHTRSNIKLKEYAAVGVPWLASPIGPYTGLGEKQGGRLVPDDRWFDELDTLVRNDRARRKLAKRASRWGREQALSRNTAQWEQALSHAIARARGAA
jgi:glycosyltransferase involved in cell wall biosynthesis